MLDTIRTLGCALLLSAAASQLPADDSLVTATLLDGSAHSGELVSLSMEEVRLNVDGEERTLRGDQLMQLDFPAGEAIAVAGESVVTLADQTRLSVTSVTSDGTTVSAVSPVLGELSLPVRNVRDVRFVSLDEALSAGWEDLRNRNARDDLLVVRKGDVLDYSPGSIGRIDGERIVMLVRDRELAAPRERVFGLIFAARSKVEGRTLGVKTRAGDEVQAQSLSLVDERADGARLVAASASGGALSIPLDQLRSIDFGGGRIRFLAELPFDGSGSRPPDEEHPVVWFVAKDAPAGSGGRAPLVIGRKEYRRGLWLHSGAVLRFRLNREFTRFRATAGFELTHVTRMPRFDPAVRLTLAGDGRALVSQEFRWNDAPQLLEADLTDVRELEIRVESLGAHAGILEHFALGDAQVIQ